MAGGADVMITGVKMDPTPSNNFVEMTSSYLGGTFEAPDLSSKNIKALA
jgi:hypothetical protein